MPQNDERRSLYWRYQVPDVGDDTDFLQTLSAENGPVTSSSSIYGAFGDRPARDVVPPSSYGGKSASRANTGVSSSLSG